MATLSTTQLYSLLSEKLGKESAETLTAYIKTKIKNDLETNSATLATKQDIAALEVKVPNPKLKL